MRSKRGLFKMLRELLRARGAVIMGNVQTPLFTAREVTNMILTSDDPIVDGLSSALDWLGRHHRRVDKLDADHAWELHATTAVLVEPLPRLARAASTSERGLREITSAANAPGVRRAIMVTPRLDADADLRAVRRSE